MLNNFMWGVVALCCAPLAAIILVVISIATVIFLWILLGWWTAFVQWFLAPSAIYYQDDGNGKIVPIKRYFAQEVRYTPAPRPIPLPPLTLNITEMSPAPFEFEKDTVES